MKAIYDAIHDGVNIFIVSLSISGIGNPSATLQAISKGISVLFSSGNDGPAPQTVENDLAWILTVAASTIDRSFPTVITLGNSQKYSKWFINLLSYMLRIETLNPNSNLYEITPSSTQDEKTHNEKEHKT